MKKMVSYRWRLVALWAFAAALGSASPAAAQTVSGQATGIKASVIGPGGTTTTLLADTGALVVADDVKGASLANGSVLAVVTGATLHATTISWPNQVNSETSVADVAVTVAGTTIGADFVMSRASAKLGFTATSKVNLGGLAINGVPITVSGSPNQTISIPGGLVVINEVITSPAATTVNALHIAVAGVADVVVASAKAGVQ